MKASQILGLIQRHALSPQQPPILILGRPGLGKTSLCGQSVDSLRESTGDDWQFAWMTTTTIEAIDLRGLPEIVDGPNGTRVTSWTHGDMLPPAGDERPWIICIDEVNVNPDVVPALYQLTQERRLGEYELPERCLVICTGNRIEDKSSARPMPAAFRDRVEVVTMEFDLNDWRQWALENELRSELIAYAGFQPEIFEAWDPNEFVSPSPRSIAALSYTLDMNPPAETQIEEYAGRIGEGWASNWVGFLRVCQNMPSIDGILMSPESAIVPDLGTSDGVATCYAVVTSLASRCTANNFGNAVKYAARLEKPYETLMVTTATARDVIRKDRGEDLIQQTREFIQWQSDNVHITT